MLKSLHVKNYALISDIQIEFDKGLNIITGETGAGKSILIDALGLVLGKRADKSALRNDAQKCIIEAQFELKSSIVHDFFDRHNLDEESVTIVRREITPYGKNRMFINDTPVNLAVLAEFGLLHMEIHSQYDNLQLFSEAFQFRLLDALCGCSSEQAEYAKAYTDWLSLRTGLQELKLQESQLLKEKEFNQFLFDELQAAQLDELDEEGMSKEQEMLENAESLIRLFQHAQALLYQNENALLSQMNALQQLLQDGGGVTEDLTTRLKSVSIELQDVSDEIDQLSTTVELNPERLEVVNEAMSTLFMLKSKHQVTDLESLKNLMAELDSKLLATNDLNFQIDKLTKEYEQGVATLNTLADALHQKRAAGLSTVLLTINNDLATVGMPHSSIRFDLEKKEVGPYGFNKLLMLLSSDKGEHFAPIKKTASGGELSRINLVVKNQLSSYTALPSSIFDEIDTGVSGEVARKVGGVMQSMAHQQQLIVITHLPQIASLGQRHFYVYKEESQEGVATQVKQLSNNERIQEVAKMISGENLTESALEQSKELLKG